LAGDMLKLDTKTSQEMNSIKTTCMYAKSSVKEFKIIVKNMESTVVKMSDKLVKDEGNIIRLQGGKLNRSEFDGKFEELTD